MEGMLNCFLRILFLELQYLYIGHTGHTEAVIISLLCISMNCLLDFSKSEFISYMSLTYVPSNIQGVSHTHEHTLPGFEFIALCLLSRDSSNVTYFQPLLLIFSPGLSCP